MLCDDLEEWDGSGTESQERGDIHMYIGGSFCCKAETNTTL